MQDEMENFIQLYNTFCVDDPDRERQLLVKSLNLLYMLVSNKLSEFHAEVGNSCQFQLQLELLTEEELQSPLIQFSVNIEGYLTTGRYNKIHECMNKLPNPIFSHLMVYLLHSIRYLRMDRIRYRADIENCVEVSYRQMDLSEFARIINWADSPDDLIQYIHSQHVFLVCTIHSQPNWIIDQNNILSFPHKVLESQEITKQTLGDLIKQVNDIQTISIVCSTMKNRNNTPQNEFIVWVICSSYIVHHLSEKTVYIC